MNERKAKSYRVLDVCGLILFATITLVEMVHSQIAAWNGHYAEATYRLLWGLLFWAFFAGLRWSMRKP